MSAPVGRAPAIPAPGFADPSRDAQRAFRAILDALSHPTRSYPLSGPAQPPAALGPGLAAVALAVLDEESAIWLGGALDDAEVAAWLEFHTGARQVEAAAANFVFATPSSMPALGSLRLGSDEEPHLSATIVLDVRGCAGSRRFAVRGPGIKGTVELEAPWADPGFAGQWYANTAAFPRGVDLLLIDAEQVSALPRTTRIAAAAANGQEG
ncbi:phosphonate C-P lyase system protein PhnH [Arthrobacter methylotrophus]|uniref:Phosphonate C-P lyase system protein PhnH n=1 Tax=Arthrobacter methylotrophus TaxID=121291 RepID=A0ABV5UMH9_9MICC